MAHEELWDDLTALRVRVRALEREIAALRELLVPAPEPRPCDAPPRVVAVTHRLREQRPA
ncbi:MAG: hypothetical protein ACYC5M_14790 [Anaerolineae bacterium]